MGIDKLQVPNGQENQGKQGVVIDRRKFFKIAAAALGSVALAKGALTSRAFAKSQEKNSKSDLERSSVKQKIEAALDILGDDPVWGRIIDFGKLKGYSNIYALEHAFTRHIEDVINTLYKGVGVMQESNFHNLLNLLNNVKVENFAFSVKVFEHGRVPAPSQRDIDRLKKVVKYLSNLVGAEKEAVEKRN